MLALRERHASVSTALAVLLLGLGPISALGAVPAAHAQDTTMISITTSNGATVCPHYLNGAWDQATSTCSIAKAGSVTLSGEEWVMVIEILHFLFDMSLDPEYALYIPQGTTLNVGFGVYIYATSSASSPEDEVYAIINAGTLNNNGTIEGYSSGNGVMLNSGTINNRGWMQFGYPDASFGILNTGTINNGQPGYLRGFSDLYGVINSGTINNNGVLEGEGSSKWVGSTATTAQGILNDGGVINNGGSIDGTSSWGQIPECVGEWYCQTPPYGIYNQGGTINDYCSPLLTYSTYGGDPPNPISCAKVTFHVEGIPWQTYSDADAPVTVSWGPFVLPWTEEYSLGYGSAVIIYVAATGSLTYSFPSHLTCFNSYPTCWIPPHIMLDTTCVSGCSGTIMISGDETVVVTYSPTLAPPTISVSPAAPIDGGQSVTLSATSLFSGGKAPYSCQLLEEIGAGGFIDYGTPFACSSGGALSRETGALAAGSYSFELQVTDGSSPAQVVVSNAVVIVVNPALVAPTVSAFAGAMDLGQSVALTSTPVSTGTPTYAEQWYWEAPGQATFTPISGATSSIYDFSTASSTATGDWSFVLGVTDSSGIPVTVMSSPVQVTVYADPTVAVSPSGPLWYVVGQSSSALTATVTYSGRNVAAVEWYSSATPSCTSSSTDTGVSGPSFTPGTTSPGTVHYCAVVFDSGVPSYSGASNPVEVSVLSPSGAIQQLITTVNGMNLPQGTTTSLDAKLTAALSSLDGGNSKAAANQLNAFINQVNAQTGKAISPAQALQLITAAQAIISAESS